MTPEHRKEIEAVETLLDEALRRLRTSLPALDAAEARAEAAEERVRELEEALKFSYTLACRGVDRIDEENKTAGPRLARVHRQRLTTMCNQIKKHVDQALKAQGSGE